MQFINSFKKKLNIALQFLSYLPIQIHFIISSLLFLILVIYKIKNYTFNPSALIGIWEGFHSVNPSYVPKGFVVFKDGGYDGQFFFFNAEVIANASWNNLPILDSFVLRFYRIGLSILGAISIQILGVHNYPVTMLILLHSFHIASSYILYKLLNYSKYRSYYLLYLYSPFSWNSNLLLVSDSFLASIFIILIWFFQKSQFPFLNSIKHNDLHKSRLKRILFFLVCFFIATLFVLTKETALPVLGSALLFSLFYKRFFAFGILFFSILGYFVFRYLVQSNLQFLGGTNPMQFLELADWPLFGFFKSFTYLQPEFGGLAKEFTKLIIFGIYISLILQLRNIRTFPELIQFLPLTFFILLVSIAEVGYWLSFDNVSRFFTMIIPYCLLLAAIKKKFRFYGLPHFTVVVFILFLFRTMRSPIMNYFLTE